MRKTIFEQAELKSNWACRKVYVKGLPTDFTQDALRQNFEEYGQVVECVVKSDKEGCHGFIVFKDIKAVENALRDPVKLIKVKYLSLKLKI